MRELAKKIYHQLLAALGVLMSVFIWLQQKAQPSLLAMRIAYWRKRFAHFGQGSKVYGPITALNPQQISIGESVTLNHGVMLIAKRQPIVIGDRVRISAGVKISSTGLNLSGIAGEPREHRCQKVTIGNDVWIALNAVITPGTVIGNNVTVAAGAVVSGVVEDNVIVAGIPAKPVSPAKKS